MEHGVAAAAAVAEVDFASNVWVRSHSILYQSRPIADPIFFTCTDSARHCWRCRRNGRRCCFMEEEDAFGYSGGGTE